MQNITADQILMWEGIATQLFSMGVRSFNVIKAAMADAGADDATIAGLQSKWDLLVNDVRRAAGPNAG